MSAERRQVTIVFCDLVGSTGLARSLDPEDLGDVLRRYRRLCASEYERHGGHLLRVVGDGLLILFGYPAAHEDAAIRAVRAGIAIATTVRHELEHAGRPLAVRVGIATGTVVVDEGEVIGETPNLAARIQALGQPNSVLIAPLTRELVGARFECAALGAQRLKGFGVIEVYRAESEKRATSRFDVRRSSMLSPFVGRDTEIEKIQRIWAQIDSRVLETVVVEGDTGIGKSRLLHETQTCLTNPRPQWIDWRCDSEKIDSPFHCFIDYFERAADAAGAISVAEKRQFLRDFFESADATSDKVDSRMAPLLGLPPPAPHRFATPAILRREIIDLGIEWLRRIAAEGPTVLAIEDVHWVDPSSRVLLREMRESCRDMPVLILLTTRPTGDTDLGDRAHLTSIPIGPLEKPRIVEMLGGDPHPRLGAELIDQLVERADGVPLFAEELARAASAAGGTRRGDLPASVQDSLLARLDGIGHERELIQTASIIGRIFPLDLLRIVAQQDEAKLRRRMSVVVEEGLIDWDDAASTRLRFKHALFHEAAYSSTLIVRRKDVHGRVAMALEEYFPERVMAHPEEIGRHYREAGAAQRAIPFYQRAGEKAAQRSAHHEAIVHFRMALEMIPLAEALPDPSKVELPIQVSLVQALLPARGYGEDGVLEAGARALELCAGGVDRPELFQALVAIFLVRQTRGETARARDIAEEIERVAERSGDPFRRQWAHLLGGMPAHYQGHWKQSEERFSEAVRLYDIYPQVPSNFDSEQDLGVTARCMEAEALWALGETTRARELDREALDVARRSEKPNNLTHALVFSASFAHGLGDAKGCLRAADEALVAATRFEFPMWIGNALVYRGWALAAEGDPTTARDVYQSGLRVLSTTGARLTGPRVLALMAEIALADECPDDALRAAESGQRIAEAHTLHFWDAELARLCGRARFDMGECEEAIEFFEHASELARAQGSVSLEVRARLDLARALSSGGEGEKGRQILADVVSRLPDPATTFDVAQAHRFLEGQGSS